MRKTIAVAAALASLALAPSALGAYGDDFAIMPINSGPGTVDVPALPDKDAQGNYVYDRFFWAGACDRSAAVGLPAGTPFPGGAGAMPTTVAGDAPAPPTLQHCIDWQRAGIGTPDPTEMWSLPPQWRLGPVTQAGAHVDGTTTFAYDTPGAKGYTDNIAVKLPAGFVANPNAVAKCTARQFGASPSQCPPASQVGVLSLKLEGTSPANLSEVDTYNSPIFNLVPRAGNVAELGLIELTGFSRTTTRIVAKARTNDDFGVTAFVGQIPNSLPLHLQSVTLWGVPWAAHNDVWRAPVGGIATSQSCSGTEGFPHSGLQDGAPPFDCQQHYKPSWGPIEPFVSLETECNPVAPVTRLLTDAYQFPGNWISDGSPAGLKLGAGNADPDESDPDWKRADSPSPPVTGCGKLPFAPTIALDPKRPGSAENRAADSPTGVDVELRIPQNDRLPFDPPADGADQSEVSSYVANAGAYWNSDAGLATAHLKETVVTLARGMTLNPAAADGQQACSMAQIGVTDVNSPVPPKVRFNNAPVGCPDASRVGEVMVETPLLDPADWPTGSVYLAEQKANPFNSDFAIYIAIASPERGFIAKLAGRVETDPVTGQVTTTFADNPELPFDVFRLRFKAGPRAPLATPTTCGTHTGTNRFGSHAQPTNPVSVDDSFQIDSSPAGGCPATAEQRPLNVGFSAGSTNLVGGFNSPFTVRLTRPDGNQEVDRIEVTTPEGLAAKLAGVPYCPESALAQASARTATGDGALERANPSCPAASQVGTTTIGAGAGPSPLFVGGKVYLAGPYKGAPVSLAFVVPAVAGPFDLGVQVVRTALQVNPRTAQVTAVSDTVPKILRGIPLRIRDIRVDIDRPGFIVNPTDCSEQQVRGRVFGASGAVTDVSNRFQIAECARLGFKPKLSLRVFGGTKRGSYQRLRAVLTARPGDANIARAAVSLPRAFFLAQENIRTICTRVQFAVDACPTASVYGKATAISPLLDAPLSGPVYLRSSNNPLPDLVAALKGPDHQPIEIELAGRTDSHNQGIRNTFDVVPDAPVSKFTLEMQGGKKSLIVNSRDICKFKSRADVLMNAQNGRTLRLSPLVVNGKCKKAKKGKRRGSARGTKG